MISQGEESPTLKIKRNVRLFKDLFTFTKAILREKLYFYADLSSRHLRHQSIHIEVTLL